MINLAIHNNYLVFWYYIIRFLFKDTMTEKSHHIFK